ncbi:MAG: hypothetical protein HC940_00255 [Acaryochloris sp. SU_5_25]|nr:hypothetical protein [Acaryochloris sp. SU_5_25]
MAEHETEPSKRDHQIKELLKRNQDLEKSNPDLEQEIERLERTPQRERRIKGFKGA